MGLAPFFRNRQHRCERGEALRFPALSTKYAGAGFKPALIIFSPGTHQLYEATHGRLLACTARPIIANHELLLREVPLHSGDSPNHNQAQVRTLVPPGLFMVLRKPPAHE